MCLGGEGFLKEVIQKLVSRWVMNDEIKWERGVGQRGNFTRFPWKLFCTYTTCLDKRERVCSSVLPSLSLEEESVVQILGMLLEDKFLLGSPSRNCLTWTEQPRPWPHLVSEANFPWHLGTRTWLLGVKMGQAGRANLVLELPVEDDMGPVTQFKFSLCSLFFLSQVWSLGPFSINTLNLYLRAHFLKKPNLISRKHFKEFDYEFMFVHLIPLIGAFLPLYVFNRLLKY